MITLEGLTCEQLKITSEEFTKQENLRFYNVKNAPFRIYGLHDATGAKPYHRLPYEVGNNTNDGVKGLNYHTAGGRVRFTTTSSYIAIKLENSAPATMVNMCLIGSSSVDIYLNRNGRDTFYSVFSPNGYGKGGYVSLRGLPGGKKEITLNLPLYSGVEELYVGLDCTAELEARADYKYEKPVLYYGSSITQGGCASRPGLAYEALISRRFDTNYVNLGFSGSARGEDIMIDYLASLECSVFVLDYDHNAPNAEHLKNTHEKLYLKFRETHPDTPVIMVGKPDSDPINNEIAARRDVIYTTYHNAKLRGEKVIFIDGYSLFAGELREECTVDGCHPNDLGMSRMADVIGKAVDYALAW